jgi:hypothetical protein
MTSPRSAPLWVVTSFFNPAGYRRKALNYRLFREHLSAPLLAVELSYDGRFALEEGRDAEIVVRVAAGDVLWQKERLLNVGIAALPARCDVVAWVDCDVLFGTRDWPERTRAALEHVDLVHLFHDRHNLPRDTPIERLATWSESVTSVSAAHRIAVGSLAPEDLTENNSTLKLKATSGLAWAMRRTVLDRHGLYDACILGGADRIMLASGLGRFDVAMRAQRMNARRAEHYLAWARPYFASMAGRVGSVSGHAFHLWHGELKDRRYGSRTEHLTEFDPFADITRGPDGAWRWSSAKPELHDAVRRYFHERDEDGEGARASALAAASPRP